MDLRYLRLFAAAVVALSLTLPGCVGTSTSTPSLSGLTFQSRTAEAKSARYIYVSNLERNHSRWVSSINIYSAGQLGNVAPVRQLVGPNTELKWINGIAATKSGAIFVADTSQRRILGYASTAQGNAYPIVSIHGHNVHLYWPFGLALDSKNNLYVTDCANACSRDGEPQSIEEFAAGSNGDSAPIRRITGTATGLSYVYGITVDKAGNIFVVNIDKNSIEEFSKAANGNAKPMRTISGDHTLINSPAGIAVDENGIYVDSVNGNSIERFSKTSNGDVPPLSEIAGTNTGLHSPDGVADDESGYVYTTSGQTILQFDGLADGNAVPVGEISGPLTDLTQPTFVYVR